MRILDIDPGPRTMGLGMPERHSYKLAYVASGTIRSNGNADLPDRLKMPYGGVSELVSIYRPDYASTEKAFVSVNPQSMPPLGRARDAVIYGLMNGNLPVFEYTVLQLKRAVVGYGRADKDQVQEVVVRLSSLKGKPDADISDALGVTICYVHDGEMLAVMADLAPQFAQKGLCVRHDRLVG